MKGCFQYTKIKQYFSIRQVPDHFKFPVKVIYPELSGITIESSNYLGSDENEKFYKQWTSDEYSTPLPVTNSHAISQFIDQESLKYESFQDKSTLKNNESLISSKTSSELKEAGVWEQDDISPAVLSYSYKKSNIVLVWTREATYRRVSDAEIEVFIHHDNTVLLAKDYGRIFEHYKTNNSDGLLRTFPIYAIPIKVISKSTEYDIKGIVQQSIDMFDNTIEERKEIDHTKPDEDWLTITEIIDNQRIENWGDFTAYKNGSILIKFEDRTHLRMKKDSPLIKIITSLGTEMKISQFVPSEEYILLKGYIRTATGKN